MMESLKGLDLSPSNSETPEAAEAAVKTFNGKELVEGMLLYLERDKKKAERQQELKRKSEALKVLKLKRLNRFQGLNLYVKNLDDTIDDERLRKEFSPFGTITSAKVIMEEGRSKGFGFVCFSSPEEAIKAVTEMNGRIVGTEPLYVALAQRKEDRKARLASQYMQLLYVKHLDNTIDNERLRKEFSPFGTITSAKVIMEEGRSKGFGFVCFSSPEEAAKAVTEMNGKIVGKKPLYVALAQRKEDRKAHLTSQYMQRMANIRMQQIGRYMQPGAQSGYFVPTLPAPPQSFHRVTRAALIRSSPRWLTQAQVRLGAQGAAAAHSNMQQNAYRAATRPPNQSAAMRNNISNMPKNITKVQPKA